MSHAGAATAIAPGPTAGEPTPGLWRRFCRGAVRFWFWLMFFWARRSPVLMKLTRSFFLWTAWHSATVARRGLLLNARHILGPRAGARRCELQARAVLGNFYDMIYEMGRALKLSRADLLAQLARTEGRDHYVAARASGKGAVLVTAHLGSFEIGAAVARELEDRVHVVFQRDGMVDFEWIRSTLRARLGLIEAPVDDGLQTWVRLREALLRNEVVLMQGDRVMPGQKGEKMPFFDGHMLMPAGPVKLALSAGSPIIPVFTVRGADRRIRVCIEPAVIPASDAPGGDVVGPTMRKLAAIIESYVRAHPQQWLAVHRAWCEDQPEAAQSTSA